MTYLYLDYIHTYKVELTGVTDRLDVEHEGEESRVMEKRELHYCLANISQGR